MVKNMATVTTAANMLQEKKADMRERERAQKGEDGPHGNRNSAVLMHALRAHRIDTEHEDQSSSVDAGENMRTATKREREMEVISYGKRTMSTHINEQIQYTRDEKISTNMCGFGVVIC